MTPKEKAIELVEKHLNTIIDFPYIDTEDGYCIGTGYMTYYSAIRCALIAVDEILIMLIAIEARAIWQEYYEEVKQEINKL